MTQELLAARRQAIEAGAKSQAEIQRYLSRTRASAQPSPSKPTTSQPTGTHNAAEGPPIKSKSLSQLVDEFNALASPTDRTIFWRSHEEEFRAARWRELYGLTQGATAERRPRHGPFASQTQK